MRHITVLLKETVDGLNPSSGDIVVDATLGSGGHSLELCNRGLDDLTIIGIDADSQAIERSRDRLNGLNCKLILEKSYHHKLDEVLETHNIETIDGAMFDLGISSNQLEESGRGFSFQREEPLLMTFESQPGKDTVTAEKILNTWDKEDIEAILEGFGEEKFSRRIAEAIVLTREEEKIETTTQLVNIVNHSVPKFYLKGRIHPATKTFQALRIAVNGEIANLEESLIKTIDYLAPGKRIAVISFHSIEDRIVKRLFRRLKEEEIGEIITKRPITPSDEELSINPRSRSAKLRIFEKKQ
ncbi:MAG: 16S rRNA (cytosine1402-N4)-methyltransferase [Candidatus Paceibacteria bacterium]|jgi:16S rRNA (cytosine1402-N4)-methyltransferase